MGEARRVAGKRLAASLGVAAMKAGLKAPASRSRSSSSAEEGGFWQSSVLGVGGTVVVVVLRRRFCHTPVGFLRFLEMTDGAGVRGRTVVVPLVVVVVVVAVVEGRVVASVWLAKRSSVELREL